jgi:purine-cytosine permease-like protein
VIGYWASAFAAVVLAEHVVFRRARFDRYDIAAWNTPGALPPGLAGLGAALLAVPLVVPSMAQAWYVGPIGARAGDIGFEVAFAVAGLAYVPLRALEKRVFER